MGKGDGSLVVNFDEDGEDEVNAEYFIFFIFSFVDDAFHFFKDFNLENTFMFMFEVAYFI